MDWKKIFLFLIFKPTIPVGETGFIICKHYLWNELKDDLQSQRNHGTKNYKRIEENFYEEI